ncbi:MAG TPA: heme-binding domain-containing protein [Acidimicrobiales bacterium]|nr:heme-binding domain-containing protein [Acidimicrobiales bacterium]
MAAGSRRRFLRWALGGLVAGFVAIQLVPYGWRHPNPPVVADAPWPSAEAARLARAACYDCHSNETEWPIYAYVAPVSWLVRNDVEEGRDDLNFSRWDEDAGEADDGAETVAEGEMPPRRYQLAHAGARLSGEERQVLLAALAAMRD